MKTRILYKLKNALSALGSKSRLGKDLYRNVKYTMASCMMLLPDESYAQWFHKLYTGKRLNLKNPQTFDDMLWWLKLNNRDPMLTVCSDKYAVREYVEKCGLSNILIDQCGVYDSWKEIDFAAIPYPVILKCTTGSGLNHYFDPADKNADTKWIQKQFRHGMRYNPYILSREWNYKNVPQRIVAERAIRQADGKFPFDYRFFCFGGEPEFLMVDIERVTDGENINEFFYRNIYDMEFKLLPVEFSHPSCDGLIAPPKDFERMIEIARILSTPFAHCRVDLYNVDGKVYFGEITFYHAGGCNDIIPTEWDYKIAELIDINSPKIIRKQA